MNRYVSAIISRFRRVVEIDSIGVIYLIGEFEDGVDYYATPEGEITTDITGIYLGVGNSDGDIDLDIIEYEMTMTYPAGSEEIGLDIPFDVTAATNLQDGREVLIYAKKEGVTEHIGTATVSGGAISESVSIPSSAFTAEDTVTIELNYASGAVTDSNDVVCPNLLAITSYTLSIFSGNDIVIEGTFDDIEDITVTIKQGLITKSIVVPVVLGSWTATINASILDGFVVNQWLDIEAVSGVYIRTVDNATYIKPTVTITTPLNNARVVEMGVPITVSGTSDGETVDIISIDKYGHQYEFVTGLEVVLGSYTYDITFNDTDFDPEAVSYPLGVRDSIYLFPTEITLLPPSQFAVITPTNYTIIDTDSQFDAECLSESNVDVFCSTLKGGRFFIGTLISDGTSAVGTLTIDNTLVGTGHTEINGASRGESALRNLIFTSDGVEISVPCIVSSGKTHGLGTTSAEGEVRGDDGFTIGTTSAEGEVRGDDGFTIGTTSAEGEKI